MTILLIAWPPLLLLFGGGGATLGRFLFRSERANLKGRCWDFLSAIQLLSVMTESLWSYKQLPQQMNSFSLRPSVKFDMKQQCNICQWNKMVYILLWGSVHKQMDHITNDPKYIKSPSDMFSSCTLTPFLLTSLRCVHDTKRQFPHISHSSSVSIWPGLFVDGPSKFHS